MKKITFLLLLFVPSLLQAQFSPTEKTDLTIIVTDGTDKSKHSPQNPPDNSVFKDPIRPMGMVDAIQAAAFTERPEFGKAGFILIFCVNDTVGGKQGNITINGQTYKGIYRLIRQKNSVNERTPAGMTNYRLEGTVFFLGVS